MTWKVASRLRLLLIVGLPAMAALLLWATDAGRPLDNWLRSERDGLRRHDASQAIAVVEIDARSLARFRQWPWPRSLYGLALDRLSAAGVDTVAFDVDFSSPSTATEDAKFADSIRRSSAVVILPTFRQSAAAGSSRIVENLPIPALRAHAFLGSVNVFTDADGVLRNYRPGITTQGVVRPSLASYLASAAGTASRDFQIDYSVNPITLPHYSFADLVEGRVSPAQLAGKKVIIGATAIELGDRYATPGYGILAGVTAQALAAETLLQRTTNPSLGPWAGIAWSLLASLYLAPRMRRRSGVAVVVATLVGVLCLPLVTEHLRAGTMDVAPAVALLLAAALGTIVCDTLAAIRATRLTDGESGLPNRAAFLAAEASPGAVVVSVTFGRSEEISSIIGSAPRLEVVGLVVQKLSVASLGAQLFRMDTGRYAWIDPVGSTETLAARLQTAASLFSAPLTIGGHTLLLRPSFGSAGIEQADSSADAYARATLAGQRSAQTNASYTAYDPQMAEAAGRAHELLSDLSAGLAEGQLWVAYQAKLDMKSKAITGAEALIRWRHPRLGAVPPDEFIPLLESEGRIETLTWFVVDQVLADLRAWAGMGAAPTVAVNVSTRLFDDSGFAAALIDRAAANGVSPSQLTIEVTESAALGSTETAVTELVRLREAGFKISVDDYGTGQSTLTYLRNFPAHEIKIDQAFIRNILTDAHDHILVRSTIDLAHALGLSVVAEGIETEQTLDLLRDMGCDVGQGWAIGKPTPAADFITVFQTPRRLAS